MHHELDQLESSLSKAFDLAPGLGGKLLDDRSWTEVQSSLHRLAQVAESFGRLELCLKAQSLGQSLSRRAESLLSDHDRPQLKDLLGQLSHLRWRALSQ